jgi:hypothetical protein
MPMHDQDSQFSFAVDFEVISAASGEPTLFHRPSGIYLHSRRDPWREAHRIADDWTKESSVNLLLWGLGLGYIAESLCQKLGEHQSLWIIETRPELYSLAQQAHPQWRVWNDEKVSIIATQSLKRLRDAIEEIPATTEIRIHPASQALLRWEGGHLAELLESVSLPVKNSQAHASLLKSQTEANTPCLARCRDVSELFHNWTNEPVLVLGAGPSLTQTLKHLVHMRHRPRILASNGTLPVLAKWNIRPDLAICIESRASAKRDIDRAEYVGRLVVFPSVNHELMRDFKGTLYLAFPDRAENETESALASGVGTVMAPALDLAAKMGGNPILLAGLDLAWRDDLYAGGAERNGATPQAVVRATAISGRTIWTSPAFASFAAGLARIIERLKKANPHLHIHDLKNSGLQIAGTIPCAPEQLPKLIAFQEVHSSSSLS